MSFHCFIDKHIFYSISFFNLKRAIKTTQNVNTIFSCHSRMVSSYFLTQMENSCQIFENRFSLVPKSKSEFYSLLMHSWLVSQTSDRIAEIGVTLNFSFILSEIFCQFSFQNKVNRDVFFKKASIFPLSTPFSMF